jgi:hypothetical protein
MYGIKIISNIGSHLLMLLFAPSLMQQYSERESAAYAALCDCEALWCTDGGECLGKRR